MKNIAIIGQSPAVQTAVTSLLARDPSLGITVISADGQRPYDRSRLPGLIDRSVKENDLFCVPVDYYAAAQVQLILDKEVQRINLSRRRVVCADKAQTGEAQTGKVQVDFDGLIIADVPQVRLPQLKGIRRQGVFHLARLAAVKGLIAYLPFTETVAVEPRGFSGIRAALALKAVGKEVLVIVRGETLLEGMLPLPRAEALARALEQRGVRLIPSGGGLADIIGDNEVKAVRLMSGKVVACEMVVIEDVDPDLRLLEGTEIGGAQRIPVNEALQTVVPAVHALDAVSCIDAWGWSGHYFLPTEIGAVQAAAAAGALLGDAAGVTADETRPRDSLESFFHPQELAPQVNEVLG